MSDISQIAGYTAWANTVLSDDSLSLMKLKSKADCVGLEAILFLKDKSLRRQLSKYLGQAAKYAEGNIAEIASSSDNCRTLIKKIVKPEDIKDHNEAVLICASLEGFFGIISHSSSIAVRHPEAGVDTSFKPLIEFTKKLIDFEKNEILDEFIIAAKSIITLTQEYYIHFERLDAGFGAVLRSLLVGNQSKHAYFSSLFPNIIEDFEFAAKSKDSKDLATVIASFWRDLDPSQVSSGMWVLRRLEEKELGEVAKISKILPNQRGRDWLMLFACASDYRSLRKIIQATKDPQDVIENIKAVFLDNKGSKKELFNLVSLFGRKDKIIYAAKILESDCFEFLTSPNGQKCLGLLSDLAKMERVPDLQLVMDLIVNEQYAAANELAGLLVSPPSDSNIHAQLNAWSGALKKSDYQIPEDVVNDRNGLLKFLNTLTSQTKAKIVVAPSSGSPSAGSRASAGRTLQIPEKYRDAHEFYANMKCGQAFRQKIDNPEAMRFLNDHFIKDSTLWGNSLAAVLNNSELKKFYFSKVLNNPELNSSFEEIMGDASLGNKFDEVMQFYLDMIEKDERTSAADVESNMPKTSAHRRNTSPVRSFNKIIIFAPRDAYSESRFPEVAYLRSLGIHCLVYDSDFVSQAKSALQNADAGTLIIRQSSPISHPNYSRIRRLTPNHLRKNLLCYGDLSNLGRYIQTLYDNRI